MGVSQLSPVYEDLLDYLVAKATPQEIMAFKASESAQERARDLMDRNNAGTLTPDETAELQQILQVERLVAMLKARAMAALKDL